MLQRSSGKLGSCRSASLSKMHLINEELTAFTLQVALVVLHLGTSSANSKGPG